MDRWRALFQQLHERGQTMPDTLRLRLHRAISWGVRATAEADPDARFLFFWIAFNAAYAQELPHEEKEWQRFRRFIEKIVALDRTDVRRLEDCIEDVDFAEAFLSLVDNRYVHRRFWDVACGGFSRQEWEQQFRREQRDARWHLEQKNTRQVLLLALERLYLLRNQIVHGGATWASSVNRMQVEDAATLMERITPIVVAVMLAHPEQDWGSPQYPPVDSDARPDAVRMSPWQERWQKWMQALGRKAR